MKKIKNYFKPAISIVLLIVMVFCNSTFVSAEKNSVTKWNFENSICVGVKSETPRTFSPEDFPEVDCVKTVVANKKTYLDDGYVWYDLVLVLGNFGFDAMKQAVVDVETNDLVSYAKTNTEYEQCDYTITINHDSYQLRIGETVNLKVSNVMYQACPAFVKGFGFTVDKSVIDDSQENIVQTFNNLGIMEFWARSSEYSYSLTDEYKFKSSEDGFYWAKINSEMAPYNLIDKLANNTGIIEIFPDTNAYTGGYTHEESWSTNNSKVASVSIQNVNGLKTVTVKALSPGEANVKVTHSYYGSSDPFALCKITVIDEYMPGDVNKDAEITASDALVTLQHSVGKIVLTDDAVTLADINNDGVLTSADALEVLRKAVKTA